MSFFPPETLGRFDIIYTDPPWMMWGDRKRIVALYGDRPRIEVFARTRTPGWEAFGNDPALTASL